MTPFRPRCSLLICVGVDFVGQSTGKLCEPEPALVCKINSPRLDYCSPPRKQQSSWEGSCDLVLSNRTQSQRSMGGNTNPIGLVALLLAVNIPTPLNTNPIGLLAFLLAGDIPPPLASSGGVGRASRALSSFSVHKTHDLGAKQWPGGDLCPSSPQIGPLDSGSVCLLCHAEGVFRGAFKLTIGMSTSIGGLSLGRHPSKLFMEARSSSSFAA